MLHIAVNFITALSSSQGKKTILVPPAYSTSCYTYSIQDRRTSVLYWRPQFTLQIWREFNLNLMAC